ncbi:hypothetical protein Taro_009901, partial [Colocasia esculenta]|nr:hypothetical protein [Colocasia esculenta]
MLGLHHLKIVAHWAFQSTCQRLRSVAIEGRDPRPMWTSWNPKPRPVVASRSSTLPRFVSVRAKAMAFRGSLSRSLFASARSSLHSPGLLPRQRPRSPTATRPERRRLNFAAPRPVAALGCSQSLLPLHSVLAATRLTSHLSLNARACCELSQAAKMGDAVVGKRPAFIRGYYQFER